ncbi:YMGG-like glycine zipper-containing protein [Dyadobacter sp. CY356]|uniref:YMGG-like glycine zipper-containing protein n=1 Tax=Dyadobacter sp. CY356 TaxID=2906442 RepID=UPI001F257A44|nr:YMGG-like glycine zipper-containing protein [Dyadobacter sp. CY356]MCF0058122.1 YMGG-like glycine zipper-containing protein [Dyadobacter sp. CY356]
MKTILSVVSAAIILSACNGNPNNGNSSREAELLRTKQMTVDSMQAVIAKQAVIDSMKNVAAENEKKNKIEEDNNQAVSNSNVAQETAPKKKKWNNAAKGAAIGAGTGAIAGAIIGKGDRAKGALVGSIVGGGVGVGTGLVADGVKKKKNRAN